MESKTNWSQVYWEQEKVEKGIVTDTIVIHHTGLPAGIKLLELSDRHRERLYQPRYASDDRDPFVKGQVPHSGHYRLIKGKVVEVFYGYHWLIRSSGKVESLLLEHEVGWHSGKWSMNMRSLAICFDGDLSKEGPSNPALNACARILQSRSNHHPIQFLMGHCDVRENRECPGQWFNEIWKEDMTGRQYVLELAGLKLDQK